MRLLVLYISIMLFLFLSCTNSSRESLSTIEGSWFYIDKKDSSYNELYFTENLHFYNLNSVDVGPIFNYKIVIDSLFISRDGFQDHNNFLMKLIGQDKNNLLVIFNKGDTTKLEPIPMKGNVFRDLHMGVESKIKLVNGRFERGVRVLRKKGLLKEQDTVLGIQDSTLIIPIPER